MKKWWLFSCLIILVACNAYKDLPTPVSMKKWKVKRIPPTPQVESGDPDKGFEYIIYGEYVGSGIPFEVMEKRFAKTPDTVLNRTGDNANLNYAFTVFTDESGVRTFNGNCFTCHASELDGQVILGLGNSFSDYRQNFKALGKGMRMAMKLKYGKNSPEWEAYEDFGHYFEGSADHIRTNQPGINPAAHLAEACVAYRDPQTLEYTGDPIFELPDYVIGTDVPPLWHVAKKNALYYTAVGRGDFTKLLFQASVLGIADSAAARKAVTNFRDVVAWLEQLEPPAYPKTIDQDLAAQGKPVFEKNCSSCHGTYGDEDTYPNKVVALDEIKTDPYYATYAVKAPIVEWYNNSWFAQSYPYSYFEPEPGYIAPPLDGIWATAPYLHNGSVPTVETLLNSKKRPTYWRRSGNSRDYNYDQIGWNYKTQDNGAGKWTYDTTLPGYSNAGHYFGDELTDKERKSVVEYLKTL